MFLHNQIYYSFSKPSSYLFHGCANFKAWLQKLHNIYPNANYCNTQILHHLPRRTHMAGKPAEESLRLITQRSTSPSRTVAASRHDVPMQDDGPSRLSSWRNDSKGRNHGNAEMAEWKVIYAWSATLDST